MRIPNKKKICKLIIDRLIVMSQEASLHHCLLCVLSASLSATYPQRQCIKESQLSRVEVVFGRIHLNNLMSEGTEGKEKLGWN